MIELVMVVVIVGLLSAVAIVRIGFGGLGRPGVAAVARRLALDLRHARSLAVTSGINHYVGFNPSGYSIYRRQSPADVSVETQRTIPRGIGGYISAWAFEFDPTGAARDAYWCELFGSGARVRVTVIAATGTTTVNPR